MPLFSPGHRGSPATIKVHIDDNDASGKFVSAFSDKLLNNDLDPDRPRVIICIGTDRSTGDSLGPLVGSKLQEISHSYFHVLGTLENPVHATNLSEYLKTISDLGNPFVVAIDACLGNIENVGFINIGEGALKPGAGVNKLLPAVGHIHITGIVNVGGFMEYFVLQNTRLHTVVKMAGIISDGIHRGCLRLEGTRKPEFMVKD